MATRQTKSFIILCILAVLLTYVSILVSKKLPNNSGGDNSVPAGHKQDVVADAPKPVVIDSTKWATYTDPSYPVSFKYPADWQVKAAAPTKALDWYVISAGPKTAAADTINVYISTKDYFALDGVKTTKTKISGYDAVSAQDFLYGIKKGKNFYTFDAGTDPSLFPYFTELMKTIAIK